MAPDLQVVRTKENPKLSQDRPGQRQASGTDPTPEIKYSNVPTGFHDISQHTSGT